MHARGSFAHAHDRTATKLAFDLTESQF